MTTILLCPLIASPSRPPRSGAAEHADDNGASAARSGLLLTAATVGVVRHHVDERQAIRPWGEPPPHGRQATIYSMGPRSVYYVTLWRARPSVKTPDG